MAIPCMWSGHAAFLPPQGGGQEGPQGQLHLDSTCFLHGQVGAPSSHTLGMRGRQETRQVAMLVPEHTKPSWVAVS